MLKKLILNSVVIILSIVIFLISPRSSYADYNAFTINIPNSQGGYTAVEIKQSGTGYTGPKGEYYSQFPTVAQLQTTYRLSTPTPTPSVSSSEVSPPQTNQFPAGSTETNDQSEYGVQYVAEADLAQAMIVYLSMGFNVLQTPGYQGNLRQDCMYDLKNMQVLGRLQNEGVMISVAGMDAEHTPIAFLYTNENLQPGTGLYGWAHFAGVQQFRDSIGDEKEIPTFRMGWAQNKTE